MPTVFDSAGRRSACIFFLIFLLLLLIYYPSFRNPPRSDYWPAFWAFRLVDAPGSPYGLETICNYDPFGHGTFRPLFYVYLFLEYRIFGSWFAGNHLLSFGLYFLCLLLFYRVAVRAFRADPAIAAVFTALLAFLFSHFDIVTWTFHLASLAGFAFMLGGFLLFSSFHRTGDPRRLAGSVLLFLPGMFSYEVFAPWPAALIGIEACFPARGNRSRRAGLLLVAGAVLAVYICYLGGVLLSRGAASYMGRRDVPSFLLLLFAGAGVFFNLLYNSVAVNLLPILPVPATVADNVDMGGMLLRWSLGLYLKIIWAGAAGFCLCAAGIAWLWRRKRRRTAAALALLLYLYFSYYFMVVAARLTTNLVIYPYTQFRYQFVPNAVAVMAGIVLICRLLRPRRREKFVIAGAVLPLIAANAYLSWTYSSVISEQLAPLGNLLENVKTHLDDGRINPTARLYIDPAVTEKLPQLCWNRTMAKLGMIRGTYQWIFNGEELASFTDRPENAVWTIGPDNPTRIGRIAGRLTSAAPPPDEGDKER